MDRATLAPGTSTDRPIASPPAAGPPAGSRSARGACGSGGCTGPAESTGRGGGPATDAAAFPAFAAGAAFAAGSGVPADATFAAGVDFAADVVFAADSAVPAAPAAFAAAAVFLAADFLAAFCTTVCPTAAARLAAPPVALAARPPRGRPRDSPVPGSRFGCSSAGSATHTA
ncbi:hypothetical protein GXW82_36050 [Streptacidiphilus sp. 4-A2]|nr:hypothetical protein [Streptacidiphilus sp. 4-A2]